MAATDKLLNDRYQFLQVLGQRDSSDTILVQDLSLSPPRPCVIQPLRGVGLGDESVELALHLAQLCQHPQLPTLLDSFLQGQQLYGVFEWKAGQTLEQILAIEGIFSPEKLRQFLVEALDILKWIHGQRFFHGDLNPHNFRYCTSGESAQKQLVLVNFMTLQPYLKGIKSFMQDTASDPEYAAPEQLRGQVFCTSDLYSLGVIGMHLITDLSPFDLYDPLNSQWAWRSYLHWNTTDGLIPSQRASLLELLEQLALPSPLERLQSAEVALQHLQQIQIQPSEPQLKRSQSITALQPALPTIPSWKSYAVLSLHERQPLNITLAIHLLGSLFACAGNHCRIHLWQLPEGASLGVLQTDSPIRSITFISDLLLTGSKDGTLQGWNLDKRVPDIQFQGHSQAITALTVSPDGQILLSGSADKTLRVWDIATQKLLATLTGHRLSITTIAYSPSQSLAATASLDSTIRLWDLQTHQQIAQFTAHTRAVRALAFHPSGQWLASGGDDNVIHLWDIISCQKVFTLSVHAWNVSGLLFTADGQQLISSSWDKTIKFWNFSPDAIASMDERFQPCFSLEGHEDSIMAIALSSDQQILISASKDCILRLWCKRQLC
jgi:WD40 repeat protein